MSSNNTRFYESKLADYYEGNVLSNELILSKVDPECKNVLDIGCAKGNLGAFIKKMGASVYGIELNIKAAQEAEKKLDHVICGDIEKIKIPYQKDFFDCIILGDVLEHLVDPWTVLEKIITCLSPTGSIIACIPNIAHISIFKSLILGQWTYKKYGILDDTHLRFFTLNEIITMFQSTGFNIVSIERILVDDSVLDDTIINHLENLCVMFGVDTEQFSLNTKTLEYVVEAKKA